MATVQCGWHVTVRCLPSAPLSSELAETRTKGSSAVLATELKVVGKGPVVVEAAVSGNIFATVAL